MYSLAVLFLKGYFKGFAPCFLCLFTYNLQ